MFCILISGIPASGKTFLSKDIANRLMIPVISKDMIKEILFDEIGFNSREEKVKLGFASMKLMYYVARQLMNAQKSFVLENNFENDSIQDLLFLINETSYSIIHIHVTGDYPIIYERFINRDQSEERHLGHVLNSKYPCVNIHEYKKPTFEEFVESIRSRGMDNFKITEHKILIDNTDFSKVHLDDIMQEINSMIEN